MILLSHHSYNLVPQEILFLCNPRLFTRGINISIMLINYNVVCIIKQLSKDISSLGVEINEVEERIKEVHNLKDILKKWYQAEFS